MASPPKKMPSDLKAIVMAYNVPKGTQPAIRANAFAANVTHDSKRVKKYPLPKGPRMWKCAECGKLLSSKRSYNEHLNIHSQKRPFECEYCEYAAASQMTLRRHVLRNHTSPRDWGYKCPYCSQAYMEPASYQQHVQSRHFGKSCTYGCPYHMCSFTTKCFRHFREHLMKHDVSERYNGPAERHPYSRSDSELQCYLVDDECGEGYQGTNCLKRRWKSKPLVKAVIYTNNLITKGAPANERPTMISHQKHIIERDDFMKQPLQIKPRVSLPVRMHYRQVQIESVRPNIGAETIPVNFDWIENEVEVESSEPLMMPDGQEDFELD